MVTSLVSLPPEVGAAGRDGYLRVLVVEDNVDLAQLTSVLLVHHGFDVATAADGHIAIERAVSFRPHVILLDIGLPGMDGYQVADALRADPRTKDALIIAISAYDRDDYPGRSGQAGFDHHLVKPVDFDDLVLLFNPGPSGARRPATATPVASAVFI
jgi:two-component system, sensor histidine kinase